MSWRERVLQGIQPGAPDLILIADPDGLMAEEDMLSTLESMGFDILFFGDPIAFRYVYESKYRPRRDRGETAPLVVVVQDDRQELRRLPFDVWVQGRKVFLSLADIFPRLSYPVVASLEKRWMDKLYESYEAYSGPHLGERATKDFVLEHVFGIAVDLIQSPVDLMKTLLSRHCRSVTFPKALDDHVVASLRNKAIFNTWPLEDIVPDRELFFKFLQREWKQYVTGGLREESTVVPFGDYDIRVYMDTLFAEGRLEQVDVETVEGLPDWVLPGVSFDRHASDARRLAWLLREIRRSLPEASASHRDWQHTAVLWAEMQVLRFKLNIDSVAENEIEQLHDEVEDRFARWMLARYGSLASLPYTERPVMVHHVSRHLAYQRAKGLVGRVALLVIDGLSLDQWLIIRDFMREKHPAWRFEEGQVFAWVPTLTSVSRQSLFAGDPPMYLEKAIRSTSKEESLWYRLWEDSGVGGDRVYYAKSWDDSKLQESRDLLEQRPEVVGLVIDKVDRILHGMELGIPGMHQQVRLWVEQGWIGDFIDFLLKNQYTVFLTSDHGNIAAKGVGKLQDGILSEVRGERARVYGTEVLRKQMMEKAPGAIAWPGVGLPHGYCVLLASGRTAFVQEGQETVTHGGISLEEVVVPFVKIWEGR